MGTNLVGIDCGQSRYNMPCLSMMHVVYSCLRAVNDAVPSGGSSSSHVSSSVGHSDSSRKSSENVGPIRFAVRSLGWVCIDEQDLTPARSSRAVNKCIVDLSLGRNDINDVVGRWGDVR